jgi:hypothetical protein
MIALFADAESSREIRGYTGLFGNDESFRHENVCLCAAAPRRSSVSSTLRTSYDSLTKYFPGSCLTSRFSSRASKVEETVALGKSHFDAIWSIGVSVGLIAS